MNSLKRYRVVLKQITPFMGPIDSIKIYGALIRAYSELYGNAYEIIQAISEGKIRVSSPMPYNEDNFYLFKPNLKADSVDYKDFKKFKNMQFVPEELAIRALVTGIFEREVINEILRNQMIGFKSIESPGVFVPRTMGETRIYYKESLIMDKVWIMISVADDWETKVFALIRYLSDIGLSKKQSSGFGLFEIFEKKLDKITYGLKYRMLISKYIPSKEELGKFPFEYARYGISTLSGYSRYGEVIPPTRCITEGSVYPADRFDGIPNGRVIDISKNYTLVGVPEII